MERGKLCFAIGLPRSGKSHYCDQWAREYHYMIDDGRVEERGDYRELIVRSNARIRLPIRPRAIVAGDDFRTAIHGKTFIHETEGFVFAAMDAAVRALLSRGFDVIIDETSTTAQTITRYLRIDIRAEPVWINTPVEVCKERALSSNKPFLIKPIERMSEQLNHLRDNWDQIHQKIKEYVLSRQEQDIAV